MTTASVAYGLVSPPKQKRSLGTYNRILDALDDLLQKQRFEDITIREIVHRSGTSTGSFYARFPTKDALLPALYARYDGQLHSLSSEQDPTGATLEQLVEAILRRIIDRLRRRRWLTRAVALHARLHPELIPAEMRRRRNALHREWRELVLAHRARIGHPDPESAVALGLFTVITACRERIVFPDAPHASSFALSDDRLVEEMVRCFLNYLEVEG